MTKPCRPSALLAALMLVVATTAAAQEVDYSRIDVSKLPETQIKTYATKLSKSGMTLDDVLAQAELRGATPTQLSQIRSRLSRYMSNSSSRATTRTKTTTSALPTSDPTATAGDLYATGAQATVVERRYEFTDEDKMLFGFDFFNRDGLTFEPGVNSAVSDSYVIGVGDAVDIDIYGAAEQYYELSVASDGTLNIPMVGPVRVGGLTLADARQAIMSRLRAIYSDMGGRTNASIRLAQANPVKVSVMGEAFMPGTYTVSASASLFNVLYLSGGPNSKGSYRDIQLIRGGRIVARLDIYDFLVNGRNDVNVGLADGDIVMIPPYIKRVMMGGAFKREGYFEAKEGETAADLIRYAGGFTPRAMRDHMGVFRVGRYTTEYLDIHDPGALVLQSGDSLVVASIDKQRVDNIVTASGALFAPGNYEWTEGMTLRQLLSRAGGIKENAFMSRGVISRYKDDYTLEALNFNVLDVWNGVTDIALRSGDEVTVASIDEMREFRTVTLGGEVQYPGEYEYRDNLTLGDLLVLANGLTENASTNNVEVVRRLGDDGMFDEEGNAREVRSIVITRDLALEKDGNSFVLMPFDQVFVRTKSTANVGGSVTLSGAFLNPGNYGLTSNSVRLSDMVFRSGGFTERADVESARIYRPIRLSQTERDIKLRQSLSHGDTVFYLQNGAQAYDFVSIRLKDALSQPGSSADIFLADGDQVVVPERSQTVRVAGVVQSPTSVVWQKGWDAKDYIDMAGGFGDRARKKKTYVVHANGESESVRHVLFFRRYPGVRPGSEVVVPMKPERNITAPAIISMSSTLVSMSAIIVTLLR